MQNLNFDQTITAWSAIADNVFVPHSEAEYERLVEICDCLIDQVGEDETYPLASLMEVIGALIENYEAEYVPELEDVQKVLICHALGTLTQFSRFLSIL